MSKSIVIVGAFVEIIELAEENELVILGLIDNLKKNNYLGYPILGKDNDASSLFSRYNNNPLIISPDIPAIREKLHNYYNHIGFLFARLISQGAKVSKSAQIGEGTIVQSMVNISSESEIGQFVKLNTFCNVMHNCTIGDYSTIAPNAVLLGNVSVGSRCYIGSNATILPNITITDDVIVGAGAVVTKSIIEKGVYIGCPAKKLK